MKTRKITLLAILLSISIVVSIVESFLPAIPIPGAKLGLANVITLVIMYRYSKKDAFIILLLRIILVGLLRGTIGTPTFFLSFSGGMVAYLFMYLIKITNVFSVVGVSILGAFGHSVGQIMMAIILLNTPQLIYYLPYILFISIITGVVTGLIARRFNGILEKSLI